MNRYSIIFLPGDFFEIEEAIYDQARWEEFSRLKLLYYVKFYSLVDV